MFVHPKHYIHYVYSVILCIIFTCDLHVHVHVHVHVTCISIIYNYCSGDTTEVSPGVHCQWALSLPVWSAHYQCGGLEGEHSGQCGHVHVRTCTCKVGVCCMKCWTILHVEQYCMYTHILWCNPKYNTTKTHVHMLYYKTYCLKLLGNGMYKKTYYEICTIMIVAEPRQACMSPGRVHTCLSGLCNYLT